MNGDCAHGLKDGVDELVGLLLVSALGTWTVSQLRCHSCTDYRYMWMWAFLPHWHSQAPWLCKLLSWSQHSFHLAGRPTPVFSISPDICSLLLTFLCSLWGQFTSESGICLCPCLSPRLPLLTKPAWKPCSGRYERELLPFFCWSANAVSTAKSSDQGQWLLLISGMTISSLSLLVLQQSFADFQLHFH